MQNVCRLHEFKGVLLFLQSNQHSLAHQKLQKPREVRHRSEPYHYAYSAQLSGEIKESVHQ